MNQQQLDEIRARFEKATSRYLTASEARAVYLEWERDIEFLLAHIEKLRDALEAAQTKIVRYWWCELCWNILSEDKRGHAPDCPFKILED